MEPTQENKKNNLFYPRTSQYMTLINIVYNISHPLPYRSFQLGTFLFLYSFIRNAYYYYFAPLSVIVIVI